MSQNQENQTSYDEEGKISVQMMNLTQVTNNRGFKLCTFTDRYGAPCSLQESSANHPCIWFGPDIGYLDGNRWIAIPGEDHIHNRMHLTQEQVSKLLPYLQHFAETGELPARPWFKFGTF